MDLRYWTSLLFVLISVTNADIANTPNSFSYPAAATGDELNSTTANFSNNPVFRVGDPQKILWTTGADSVRLALWQNGSATAGNIEDVLCKNCSDDFFEWDGYLNGIFHYVARSRFFNMTDPSTTSSSSVSAIPTPGPSSSSTNPVTIITPTSSPIRLSSAGRENNGSKIGLGVGLGLGGGSVALAAGFFLFQFLRNKKVNTDSSYSVGNNNRLPEPPLRYFKAELPETPRPDLPNQSKTAAPDYQAWLFSEPNSAVEYSPVELPNPASYVIPIELSAERTA